MDYSDYSHICENAANYLPNHLISGSTSCDAGMAHYSASGQALAGEDFSSTYDCASKSDAIKTTVNDMAAYGCCGGNGGAPKSACINNNNTSAPVDRCATQTDKKAITADCVCGYMSADPCAKGKFCWMGMVCKDTAYPCSEKETFCGRYGIKGLEAVDNMYKEDFKGDCLDATTCPTAPADDKSTPCQIQIAMNSEPGKCMAVCSVGYTKETQDTVKTTSKCTDDEKKQWDEANEKNEAAYEASAACAGTGTKALTGDCSCGSSGVCGAGKFCWMGGYCKDTAYPCGDGEQFCGRFNVAGHSETADNMYEEDFKGACMDPTTCPEAEKDDKRTECEKLIGLNSEPGKCYAVCSIGYSKVGHDLVTSSCTDDEKKQWDESAENNQAGLLSLSSGSALAPTFAVATTAAIVVLAALY